MRDNVLQESMPVIVDAITEYRPDLSTQVDSLLLFNMLLNPDDFANSKIKITHINSKMLKIMVCYLLIFIECHLLLFNQLM